MSQRRPKRHTFQNERHQNRGHQTPFSIVQEVLKPHPGLCLFACFPVGPGWKLSRDKTCSLGKVVAEVLGDETAFNDNFFLFLTGKRDADCRGFAQRMDLGKLRGRKHGFGIAVKENDVVVET